MEKISTFEEKLVMRNTPPKQSILSTMDFVRHIYYHTRMDRTGLKLGDINDLGKAVAKAKVSHGRWVVDCPGEFCNGAEYVDMNNKIFMCCSCWNTEFENKWLKVSVPENRKEIEEILLKRSIKVRNWLPDETLDDLIKENLEHGLEVP